MKSDSYLEMIMKSKFYISDLLCTLSTNPLLKKFKKANHAS